MARKILPRTLGELRASGYRSRSVKDEMRENLSRKLRAGERLFPGIHGYDDTVIRQLCAAILSRHDILLLGLRGQGKTRLLRQLVDFLDEDLPILAGSEVNDDPFRPISKHGRELVAEGGEDAPIEWLPRAARYGEKLATPDVTMADLIGDIDPIKAVRQKLHYADEGVIHFGIVPRTNRGIFAINELPDLQPRIQVGLLNILEERDIQIRGFPVRIPLDVAIAFSANPEDYTSRGNIITPLKDRIDSQILTHYPRTIEVSMAISDQEAWTKRDGCRVLVPRVVREIVEQIAFEARSETDYVDPKSGVSARLPISALENLVGTVERRVLARGESSGAARLADLEGVIPAMTGKLELVYEGEREGPLSIARTLVSKAARTVFGRHFRDPYDKRERVPEENPYYPVVSWFEEGNELLLSDEMDDGEYRTALAAVPRLREVAERCALDPADFGRGGDDDAWALFELLLEGLHQHGRLSKHSMSEGFSYRDMMAGILR